MSKRWTLITCVLASSIVLLDATVVHLALPAIEEDLGGGLGTQQWVVSAYALTLGSLILLGGSLSDVLGAKRVFLAGVAGFGLTSLGCALAPSAGALIAARALQGVAGALLAPASLAVIMAMFEPSERGRAIGTWTAWTGVATVAGPLAGGQLVAAAGWRSIFLASLPLVAATVVLVLRFPPDAPPDRTRRVDGLGAATGALGLAGPVFALIEQPQRGWGSPAVVGGLAVGVAALVVFATHERHSCDPMLPPGLLRRRNVLVGNLETVGVYAALSIVLFLLALFLQEVGSLSATEAGLATLPTTVPLMLLSRRFGALADRIGPRLLMGAGPLVMAVGLLLMLRVERDVALVGAVLPSLFVFGVGFAMTVAPLTATVLGGADAGQAGIASAVNNAVARIAGLTGIAALGPLLGARLDVPSFRTGILAAATLTAVAGAIGALFLRDRLRGVRAEECPGGAVMGAPVAVAAAGHPGRDQGARGREPVLAAGSWSAR